MTQLVAPTPCLNALRGNQRNGAGGVQRAWLTRKRGGVGTRPGGSEFAGLARGRSATALGSAPCRYTPSICTAYGRVPFPQGKNRSSGHAPRQAALQAAATETGTELERFYPMTVEMRIIDGPTKPDLLWAVGYPSRHLQIHFDGGMDSVTAHIDAIDELGDGTQLGLNGHLVSGLYKGSPFRCAYDLTTRSGMLRTAEPDPGPPSRA